MSRFTLVNWLLLAAVVALVAIPLVFVGSSTEFGGADGMAAEQIERDNPGFEPWATPWFVPEAETASGLFAAQAALGGGVLGYVFGVLRTRRRLEGTPVTPPSVTPSSATTPPRPESGG